jgi:aromatic-L-amino-acid/L-tryptophan decarboxylase
MHMDLSFEERKKIWDHTIAQIEQHYQKVASKKVSPPLDVHSIQAYLKRDGLATPAEAIDHVIHGLSQFLVHTTHPGYFGLYNPRPGFGGVMADVITAAFNPQLAAWSHSPFPIEIENMLVSEFGKRFGYAENNIDGVFCSGGAEANHTALLCALNHHFPEYAVRGYEVFTKQPTIYCSSEVHHSITKAAGTAGIGIQYVREIPAKNLAMDPEVLEKQIQEDKEKGFFPLMVVATMGTTGTATIDPIAEIQKVSKQYGCWLHADGAYGGAIIVSEKHKSLLNGISEADSIIFDAHKWLSVPMGASLFITKHPQILGKTFRIKADYMPKEAGNLDVIDPFAHSLQWSRRFIGLKLYLALLFYGWKGFEQLIDQQIEKGQYLKNRLIGEGWEIYNNSPLPVVNFGLKSFAENENEALNIAKKVIDSGDAWISVYRVKGINALRACVTNYATTEKEMGILVERLNKSRH